MKKIKLTKTFWGMRGQMGASLIFLFLTGLMLSSFALDSGVIYYKRSQMQQIVDSASMDGVSASVKGTSSADVQTLVGSLIQMQASNRNIELLGNPSVIVELPSATSPNTKVKVSATIRANYLMYKFLSCFSANPPASGGYSLTVKGAASTGRKPVILSMVLDVSGSMGEALGNSSGQSKIAAAQVAMKQIVDLLNYPEDQMALVAYSDYAQVIQPMTTVAGNQDAIKAAIDGLNIIASTDMEQGVLFGRQQMQAAAVTDGVIYDRMIILLTDGCPNVVYAKFVPSNPQTFFPTGDPKTDQVAETGGGAAGGQPMPPGWFLNMQNAPAPCESAGNGTACSLCLQNGQYYDSMGGLMGDPSTDLTSVGSPALLALARMFVDLTIREADIAKNINSGDPNAMVTFYTVGLGLPPNDAGTTDPYEFEMQDSYVHGILLRKLANDPASAADPVFIPGTSNFNPNQNTGQFFETNDTTQIAPVLQTIINKGLQTIKVTEYDDS